MTRGPLDPFLLPYIFLAWWFDEIHPALLFTLLMTDATL